MKSIRKVLFKTVVKEFYKENAGFLLVVLGLGFGFLKTPQHIDIATALALQPIYYIGPVVLWALYTGKTLTFFFRIKKLPQNWFLTDLNGLKSIKLKPLVILIQALLMVPVLGYSLFMIFIAIQEGQVNSVVILIASDVLLLMASAHFMYQRLIKPNDPSLGEKSQSWTRFLPKSYSFLFIHHLIQRHGLSLMLTKIFAVIIILGATAIFNIEGSDLRYLALGMLLSTGVGASLSHKNLNFERSSMRLYRNLPLSWVNLYGKTLLTYLMLSIPEAIVFLGNNFSNVDFLELIQMVLIIPSLSILHHGMLSYKPMEADQFAKYVFFTTSFLFFVIMGHISILLMAAIIIFASLLLVYKSRHTLE